MEKVSQGIITLIVLFAVLAAADKCVGGKWGLSRKMDDGLIAMSEMCVPMVGMLLLAPSIGAVLGPVVKPFYRALGADPAMFATSILACDMGGYALAYSLAETPEAAQFAGCILGGSLGGIITFIIPIGFSGLRKENQPYFAVGILASIATVPIGTMAGGLIAGYAPDMVLRNSLPILIVSLLIAAGLFLIQNVMIQIFIYLGKGIMAVAAVGFAIGIIQELTPVTIIEGMDSVLEGIKVVGSVGIVLCGAYPMIAVITKVFGKQLQGLAKTLRVDQVSAAAMVSSLANIMPFLGSMNEMSPAGIVVGTAFVAAAAAALGDHLGFMVGMDAGMILPMIISKMINGLAGLLLAEFICKRNHYSDVRGDAHAVH